MIRPARNVLKSLRRLSLAVETKFDKRYLAEDVPMSTLVSHQQWPSYLTELCNKPGMRVLEVGSREVTGLSDARSRFSDAEYVGFDYYAGDNVDVVGDSHRLS